MHPNAGEEPGIPFRMWRKNISVRPFAWYDILAFLRYRRQILCTDSAQALTRGSPIGPHAFLTRLNPAMEVYTAISLPGGGRQPLIGQVKHPAGHRSARISFFMPADALGDSGLPALLESMAVRAGQWGAFHLLAEIDEGCCALDEMRRTGFSVYAWQRIWQFSARLENQDGAAGTWRPVNSIDENAIRNLYQSLVPPLVQSAEPLSSRRLHGWVYLHGGEILAYVEGMYGPRGIYYQPLIHPAIENVSQVIAALLKRHPPLPDRPVYIAIRSYQAWLETVVRDLECQVGARQALMVKHLMVQQRSSVLARQSVLEKYAADSSVPLVQNSTLNCE